MYCLQHLSQCIAPRAALSSLKAIMPRLIDCGYSEIRLPGNIKHFCIKRLRGEKSRIINISVYGMGLIERETLYCEGVHGDAVQL
jgi:methionine salvage enolase-phosphatase E1